MELRNTVTKQMSEQLTEYEELVTTRVLVAGPFRRKGDLTKNSRFCDCAHAMS